MCGICGYQTTQDVEPRDLRHTLELFKTLLVITSERGRDATGYAGFTKERGLIYKKLPVPSPQFVKKGWVNLKAIPTSMIGHTRAATHGSATLSVNNHPFLGKNYAMVHNGVVSHYSSLKFDEIKEKCISECDSEMYLRYLEGGNAIKKMAKFFDPSSFAIALLNRSSGKIKIARDDNRPTFYADLRKIIGCTVFASTQEIIKKAVSATFSRFPAYTIVEIGDYTIMGLKHGKATKEGTIEKPVPPPVIAPKARYASQSFSEGYNSYQSYSQYGYLDGKWEHKSEPNLKVFFVSTKAGNFRYANGKWVLTQIKIGETTIYPKLDTEKRKSDYALEFEAWDALIDNVTGHPGIPEDVAAKAWDQAEQAIYAYENYDYLYEGGLE